MARLVLLTGLPGVGKTTVATALPSPFYERIHFGGLLRQVIQSRTSLTLAHNKFREDFYKLVDAGVVRDAILLAQAHLSRSKASICVLDSHAVTQTPTALKVTPDNYERVRLLRFDAIVHLAASHCLERVVGNSRKEGRQPVSETEAATAEQLQLAVGVFYASAHDCPLLVVPSHGELAATVKRVDGAVRSVFPDTL